LEVAYTSKEEGEAALGLRKLIKELDR